MLAHLKTPRLFAPILAKYRNFWPIWSNAWPKKQCQQVTQVVCSTNLSASYANPICLISMTRATPLHYHVKWRDQQPGISCKTSPKYQVQRGWPPTSPPPLNNRAKTLLQFHPPSFGCLSFGFCSYRHIWLGRTVSNSCSFHLNFEVKCIQTRSGWEVPPNSIDAMQFGLNTQSVAHLLHKI